MTNKNRYTLHPATFFGLLTVVVVFAAWLCNVYGLEAINPQTGEPIVVQNLLSAEGIRWWLRGVTNYFTEYAQLGTIVVAMFGIGIAEHSGLSAACIRRNTAATNVRRLRIGTVILLGLLSNLVGESGYVLLTPIAATLFRSVGLSPIGGIITAYVSVACGYSANVLLTTLDPMLSQITMTAATANHISTESIGAPANYFFMAVSFPLIAIVIYRITIRCLCPALPNEPVLTDEAQTPTRSRREHRALLIACTGGGVYACAISLLALMPHGILRSVSDELIYSPFMDGILFLLSFGIGLTGLVYGFASGRYRTDKDVIAGLSKPARLLEIYFVISFF
ncbi:MAG: AbgT family transporter, partial [Prevotellaceae bacterium]|nr:AbgT family transporter [Prevotellaceae bacterium]